MDVEKDFEPDHDAIAKDERMAARDKAKQEFIGENFHVEHLKHHIIADLHSLQGRIGHEAVRRWLTANFIEIVF